MRLCLIVIAILAAAAALPAQTILQLVNHRNALHLEERLLQQTVTQQTSAQVELADASTVSAALERHRFAVCRLGVRPESYYLRVAELRRWVEEGGTLWVEFAGVYLLSEMQVARVEFLPFLPAVRDEIYYLGPFDAAPWAENLPVLAPVAAQVRQPAMLLGRVTTPGVYGFPVVRPSGDYEMHALNSLLVVPRYSGWIPRDYCGAFPRLCAPDATVIRSNEHTHIFPHLPHLMQVPVGQGRLYVFNMPFASNVVTPGPMAARLRGAWLEMAMEESGVVPPPPPAPGRVAEQVPVAPTLVMPTATPTVTITARPRE